MYDLTTIRIKDLQLHDEFRRLGMTYKVVLVTEQEIRTRRISSYSTSYFDLQRNSKERVTLLKTLSNDTS